MISDKDRSGWFGGSDTSYIVGNWKTESFKKWWLEKLGLRRNTFTNKAMNAGAHFEHKILATIPGVRMDHQILIPELRLRVNLDGDKDGTIYEVKTHREDVNFKVSKQYWRQAQIEMFAHKTDKLYIVSYPLREREYKNYFAEIDEARILFTNVNYDGRFICGEYMPRLRYLKKCLEEGVMPSEIDYAK